MELITPSNGLIIWQIVTLASIGLFVYCLIDILKNSFEDNNKILWLFAVILLPVLGSCLYLFIGRKRKVRLS